MSFDIVGLMASTAISQVLVITGIAVLALILPVTSALPCLAALAPASAG
jgi:hypothetical protein